MWLKDRIKGVFSAKNPGGDSAGKVAWDTFLTGLRITKESLDGVPAPGLKAAIGGVLAIIDTIETAQGNIEALATLTTHLSHLRNNVIRPLKAGGSGAARISASLQSLVDKLEKNLVAIQMDAKGRIDRDRFRRVVSSTRDVGTIQHLNRQLDLALQAFQTGTIVFNATRVEDVYQVTLMTKDDVNQLRQEIIDGRKDIIATRDAVKRSQDKELRKARLDLIMALPRAGEARHDSGVRNMAGATACFPGTRKTTLAKIRTWLKDDRSRQPSIFWIWGFAGTGKSSVAQTIAEEESELGRLGASFFFSRDQASQKNPLLLFTTIAFQLAFHDDEYKARLGEALEKYPNASTALVKEQFDKLIVKPLERRKPSSRPIIIVIDALDECEPDAESENILDVWATGMQAWRNHPIKVLITSRPEPRIRAKFESSAIPSYTTPYVLHDLGREAVNEDVELYLRHHLTQIAIRCDIEIPWPEAQNLEMLVRRVGPFFIFAATSVMFIGDDKWNDPEHQLQLLLADQGVRQLAHMQLIDTLYKTVLRRAIPSGDEELAARFRWIVGTIVLIGDPMSADGLEDFLSRKRGTVLRTLKHLHSLLIIPPVTRGPIRVFHQSFPNFLTSGERCNNPRFFIDAPTMHARLADLCFKQLGKLDRDMCRIGNANFFNAEVADLEARVAKAFPEALRYACVNFVLHLTRSGTQSRKLAAAVASFCKAHILAWIESMSYLNHLSIALSVLRDLRRWYGATPKPEHHVTEVLHDAERLTSQFFKPIQKGGGHVYVAALPWAPECPLKNLYQAEIPVEYVLLGQDAEWDISLCVMEGCDVQLPGMMAVHRSGRQVAAVRRRGRGSREVGLWSMDTGSLLSTFRPHKAANISSVCFSPDGSRIVACSLEWTIYVWQLETTALVYRIPLLGRKSKVAAGSFGIVNSDDTHLISTGPSGQIYFHNPTTGALISTDTSHTMWITSVAIAPITRSQDRLIRDEVWLIATGSADSTVRVRNLGAPATVLPHPSRITNVNIVSNGEGLMSTCVSDPGLVWMWSLRSGSLLKRFRMEANIGPMMATPSGMLIVWSAQMSTRVRFMNAATDVTQTHSPAIRPRAKSLATPRIMEEMAMNHLGTVAGHAHHVTSLLLSEGRSEVVSAAKDGTMRVWDIKQYETVAQTQAVADLEDTLNNLLLCHVTPRANNSFNCPSQLSYHGNRLAFVLSNDATRLYDLGSGGVVLGDLYLSSRTMGLSPDGKHLLGVSYSDTGTDISIWDTDILAQEPARYKLLGTRPTKTLIFFSDDRPLVGFAFLFSGQLRIQVLIHEIQTLKEVVRLMYDLPLKQKPSPAKPPKTSLANPYIYMGGGYNPHTTQAPTFLFKSGQVICYTQREIAIWDLPVHTKSRRSAGGPSSGNLTNHAKRITLASKEHDTSAPPRYVLGLTDRRIAIHKGKTTVYDTETGVELQRWPKSDIVQARPDGTLSFLELRGDWLWHFDAKGEQRLCWIPYRLRETFSLGGEGLHWKGSHLVLIPPRGELAVLNVDALIAATIQGP